MSSGTSPKSKYRSFKVDDYGVINIAAGITKIGRSKKGEREMVLRVTALGGDVVDLHFNSDQLAIETGVELLRKAGVKFRLGREPLDGSGD